MSAAQHRFKQARSPVGCSEHTQCPTWGLL
jgi:hypothetical protein